MNNNVNTLQPTSDEMIETIRVTMLQYFVRYDGRITCVMLWIGHQATPRWTKCTW